MRAGWPSEPAVPLPAVPLPAVPLMVFRPLLWPTVMVVPALVVLIGLGLWQLDRRAWKLDLIATMEMRLAEPPEPLETLEAAAARGEDIHHRPVAAAGRLDHAREAFWFATGAGGQPGYHVITPLLRAGGPAVLVDRGFVPEALRAPERRTEGNPDGIVTVTGIIRPTERGGAFTPGYDAGRDLWFARDVAKMAEQRDVAPVAPFFIEADGTANPGGWPRGRPPAVRLKNDHLGYALTWFSLAAALGVVYLLYHRTRGRLG